MSGAVRTPPSLAERSEEDKCRRLGRVREHAGSLNIGGGQGYTKVHMGTLGTQGYTGVHRGTVRRGTVYILYRGTQGCTGVHRGTHGYTGLHRGTQHRGTQGYTGVRFGKQGCTGVHRGTQGFASVNRGAAKRTGRTPCLRYVEAIIYILPRLPTTSQQQLTTSFPASPSLSLLSFDHSVWSGPRSQTA